MRCRRSPCSILCCLAILVGMGCGQAPAKPTPRVLVFAASSLAGVVRTAAEQYHRDGGGAVVVHADASGRLTRQIMAGAPADLLITAHPVWLQDLEEGGHIIGDTRRDVAGNRLVFVIPKGRTQSIEVRAGFDLAATLPPRRGVAIGEPDLVPVGRYARQALRELGWWDGLEQRLLPAHDARAALRLVESGQADLGVVYATDAAGSSAVRVVAEIPVRLHDPIRYPAVLIREGTEARAFLDWLAGPEGRAVFAAAGFEAAPEMRP